MTGHELIEAFALMVGVECYLFWKRFSHGRMKFEL